MSRTMKRNNPTVYFSKAVLKEESGTSIESICRWASLLAPVWIPLPMQETGGREFNPWAQRSPGGGQGNWLQYPYPGKSTWIEAWQRTVHGLPKVRHDFSTGHTQERWDGSGWYWQWVQWVRENFPRADNSKWSKYESHLWTYRDIITGLGAECRLVCSGSFTQLLLGLDMNMRQRCWLRHEAEGDAVDVSHQVSAGTIFKRTVPSKATEANKKGFHAFWFVIHSGNSIHSWWRGVAMWMQDRCYINHATKEDKIPNWSKYKMSVAVDFFLVW